MHISIVVPTYNSEKTVGLCLGSLRDQAFKDSGVIIVDSHSKDKALEIVERYSKEPDIEVVQENTIIFL